jgi:hypothetical protein
LFEFLLEEVAGEGLGVEVELDGVGAALVDGATGDGLAGAAAAELAFDSPLALASEVLGAAGAVADPDSAGFLPPSRKSVTYQPEPLS